MPELAMAAASALAAAAPAGVSTAVASTVATTAAKAGLMATLKTAAFKAMTNFAISAAMSALQPTVGAAGRPVEWTLDPEGPIPFAAGRVGVAGAVVHKETFGPDLMYYGLVSVLSGAGPIDGFESFKGDDETVTFDGNGKAVSSQWANEMWVRQSHGWQPDLAITSPPGLKSNAQLPGWSTAHKLSGKAAYMLVMGENSKRSAYPMGEVKPLYTIRGLRCWDPRLDSTYPGGSGLCRLHDPSTWVYSANPHIWAIKWGLGLWEGPTLKGAPAHGSTTDYQVGGIGAKLSGIDVTTLVAAANIADANNWTCAAYPTTDDDKAQVLDAFLQAGGAIYAQRAGKISCIQRGAPRTSVVTISAADTAGPIEIDTAASRIDRINTIRPKYWSEAHRWQMTALDDVTAEAYRVEDGGTRPRALDFHYVTNARQTSQLAALQIAHTREGIAGVIPLKPHLQRIKPGDAFTITEPGFVLNGVKCLCLNTEFDPATKVVRVTFVSETDDKYAWALGLNPTPPAPPVLTPVDPTFVSPPEAGDWTVTPRPPAPGGGQLPVFDLVGVVSNSTATAIIVEYGISATGPWTQAYQGPPTVTNIPLNGLQPGASYYVAIRYQRNQNYSEREVYGPYPAPLLDPSPTAPTIVALDNRIDEWLDNLADETTLREQADAKLASVQTPNPNLMPQGKFEKGTGEGWDGGGVLVYANNPDLGGSIMYAGTTTTRFYPRSPAANVWSGFSAGYSAQIVYQITATEFVQVCVIFYSDDAGTTFLSQTPWENITGDGTVRLWKKENFAKPAGARTARIVFSIGAGTRTVLRGGAKIESGPVATTYTSDATTKAISAQVSQQALAIVDLATGQALAKYEVVAAATGGKPARLRLVSGSLGSAVALDFDQLFLGENTVFDNDTDTEQTTIGGNVRVIAKGLPFGAANDLLEWWGPSSIPLSSMSSANGHNGRMQTPPYVFDNVSPSQFRIIASASAAAGTRSGAGTVTTSAITFTVIGATGSVEFNALNTGGDTSVVATNPSAVDSSAPFEFITAFRTTVAIAQSKLATFSISARDAAGNMTTAVVKASLAETT